MNRNNHHIDEIFAKELGNIEITPPESVWQAIETKLDKKKHIGIWYIRLGFAASIAILTGISGLYIYYSAEPTNNIAFIKVTTDKNQTNPQKIIHNITKNNSIITSTSQAKNDQNQIVNSQASANPDYITNVKVSVNKTDLVKPEEPITGKNLATAITPTVENNNTLQNHSDNLTLLTPKTIKISNSKNNTSPFINADLINKTTETAIEAEPLYADLETKPKINRWSIEGQVAPLYSYRNITSNSIEKSDFNNNESGIVSYSNILKVNYQTNSRLSIQMGVAYSVIGQTLQNIYIEQPADNLGVSNRTMSTKSRINSSMGEINNSSGSDNNNINAPQASSYQYTFFNNIGTEKITTDFNSLNQTVTTKSDASIIQRFKVIEIPVTARYSILSGKFKWHLTGGISTNILIGNDAILKNKDSSEKIGKTSNLKPFNYAGSIGTGFGYALKKNIIILIEPTFKYYINSISNGDIKVHPFSFGVYTGISYKL